ncbi:acyl-CoA dehydrogenase family protein [Streptomyces ipomoeae]|uniref:acyl-CoA dehydrogenase family protein n=1 Tax=Streptomyces ipomoeae TaxID=103232 RepID=UPI001FD244EB|nr:acyl-CoA dehydrogenase family protein [Streptomyces ipomoeae]MDX2934965.1 acyl-CoA dehydrogenase family protein [Streptomyces ipomoeae]
MTVTADEATDAGAGQANCLHITHELADDLATDAVEREQVGKAPLEEVARLRESGLLTLLAPAEHGGGGATWRTAYTAVRTVAAADGAIGHLLGNHYFLSFSARFFAGPTRAARIERDATAGHWCRGGGIASHEPPLILTPMSGGYLLNGCQRYATGAGIADRLVVRAAKYGTGEPLAVLVDPACPGVVSGSGGDTFGQRLAAGGGVEFDSVPVAADDVLGSLSPDEGVLPPFSSLAAPTARLVSVQFCLGVADGLPAEVREYGRGMRSPWQPLSPQPWPDSPPQDPYALTAYDASPSSRAWPSLPPPGPRRRSPPGRVRAKSRAEHPGSLPLLRQVPRRSMISARGPGAPGDGRLTGICPGQAPIFCV